MAAKTSFAPLPRARNVTPARDSVMRNLCVKNSNEGDRYSSAVDDKLYMNISINSAPIGTMATTFPVSPNAECMPQ